MKKPSSLRDSDGMGNGSQHPRPDALAVSLGLEH